MTVQSSEAAESSGEHTVFGGRFRGERVLKRGLGVTTLLGHDLALDRAVVIKTAPAASVSASARLCLEHEARVLRAVHSPALVPLLDFGATSDRVYLVTPYIPGETLARRLGRGPLALHEAMTVVRSVLAALEVAHESGVIHRDVKPANVIVDDPSGRATLIDFGLSRSPLLDPTLQEAVAGTARYMSPEQAGLLERGVDARSDLYSVGVLLFECLAGRPPFLGDTLGELLRQHLTARPPDLRALRPEVPRALGDLVQRLLRKDPRDRYQSAHAVIADLDALAAALARGEPDPAVRIGARDLRSNLTEPAFIGRTTELAALQAAIAGARTGQGSLTLLEAPSGGGKSRLLDELARRASQQALVLRGEAADQAASRPLRVLDGVVRSVVVAARADPAFAAALRERLGDRRQAILTALPQIDEVLGPREGASPGPEAYGRTRTLTVLAGFLDALGTADRPAAVLLDDCQWADETSLGLLERWHDTRPAGGRYTTIVAAYRPEEVPADHPLRRLAPATRVVLPPLRPAELRDLLHSMAAALPEEAVASAVRLAQGSPFMAVAVLQGLFEGGALVAERGGWHVTTTQMEDIHASYRSAALLARRLARLPADTKRVLAVGAVLGKEFEIELAAALVDGVPDPIAALEEARRRNILWISAEGTCYRFVHDKLREALLDGLAPGERARLHLAAAERIAADDRDNVFSLAYHFDAAGRSWQALPFALAAAEQARARHALETAGRHYRIAERGAVPPPGATEPPPAPVRLRIVEGLGDVLMLLGRYAEAREKFAAARELACEELDRARVEGKLGELAFKQGDMRTASAATERGLALLSRRVPRRRMTFAIALVWEVAVQAVHSLLRRAGRGPPAPARELLAMRLLSRLAYVYWFQRGRIPCLWAHLREMNLAERFAESAELAQAYSEHAPAMTAIPWFGRGIAYAERSLAVRRRLGDRWGEGQSLHFYGDILYVATRWHEAIDRSRAAIRLLEQTGDRWESNDAAAEVSLALFRLGDLREAAELARRVHRSASEIGDVQACGICLEVWSKATQGEVPRELLEAALARPTEDVQTRTELLQAEAVRLLGEGAPDRAAAVLAEAQALVDRHRLKQEYVAPILPWLATALRSAAEALPALARDRREELLRRAQAAVRRGLELARVYRNNLPHALREAGLVAALRGRLRRAGRLLAESLALAERQGARHERALTLHARARLDLALGRPEAEREAEAAREALRACGVRDAADVAPVAGERAPVTLSLVDRFDAVLRAGRRIASSLTREAVYAAMREEGLALLRGERCAVVELSDEGTIVACDAEVACSHSMIRQALASGQPVLVVDGADQSASESVLLSGARSALCAPIFVRGRPVACLFAAHGEIGGLFGPDEARLAEFVATLGGTALENAEGLAARERLLASLREADRRKDDFLATLSHELRNPLAPICSSLYILDHAAPGSEQARRAQVVIGRQVTHLTRLIDDLLDVTRVARGKMQLQREPLDLGDLVRRAVEDHHPIFARKGIELDVTLPGRALPVDGDRTRLTQVIGNLLQNAVKFTDPGGRTAVILERRDDDGGVVVVRVRDTGIGIAPEMLSRLFEPFAQADQSLARSRGGLGLGLALARGLVELHGGSLRATSEGPGRGSEFAVRLPLQASGARSVPATAVVPTRRRRVLVIDDNADAADGLREMLALMGHEARAAHDGPSGLEQAREYRPDIVLCDIGLPGMDGYEVARALRADPVLRDMVLVALTGYAKPEDRERAAEAGFDAHLSKPPRAEVLARILADQRPHAPDAS